MKKSSKIISVQIFLVVGSIFTLAVTTQAEEQSAYAEIARERRYAGGADESDLKVQAQSAAAAKNKPAATQESNEGF